MCCTRLARNTGRKNDAKKSLSAHHRTTLSSYYLRNWGMYRQTKKNLLNSNMSSTCLHNMANFGPLTAEFGSGVWGTPANFSGFLILTSLLQSAATSLTGDQPNFARCLAVSWAGTLFYFRGQEPPKIKKCTSPGDGIFPGAKFTLRPSLAFSYIGSVTARYSSSGRQPNFAAWYKE